MPCTRIFDERVHRWKYVDFALYSVVCPVVKEVAVKVSGMGTGVKRVPMDAEAACGDVGAFLTSPYGVVGAIVWESGTMGRPSITIYLRPSVVVIATVPV